MQERIDDHEARIRRLEQQQTEEIKAINVNVGSADVLNKLKTLEEGQQDISQKQDKISDDVEELKIDAKAYTGDAAIFKNKVERMELDVSTIKTDVSTLKSDVSTLKTDMEQVKTVQSGHSKFFEEHGRRLGQIETTMATKEGISQLRDEMKADMIAMETRLIDTMTRLLQQKPGE